MRPPEAEPTKEVSLETQQELASIEPLQERQSNEPISQDTKQTEIPQKPLPEPKIERAPEPIQSERLEPDKTSEPAPEPAPEPMSRELTPMETQEPTSQDATEPYAEPIPESTAESSQEKPPEKPPEKPAQILYCHHKNMYRECRLQGIGDCGSGRRTCPGQGVFGPCLPHRSKTPETCDGRDNDCDGLVDEDFPKTKCCVPTTLVSTSSWLKKASWNTSLHYGSLNVDRTELSYMIPTKTIVILDRKTGKIKTRFGHFANSTAVKYHPKKRWVIAGGIGKQKTDTSLYLYDISTGKVIREYKGREANPKIGFSYVLQIFFSSDGSLVTATYSSSVDITKESQKQTVVWNVDTGSVVQTMNLKQTYIHEISFSHDNKLMATSAESGKVKLWRLSDGKLLHTLEDKSNNNIRKAIGSSDFHPTKPILISASLDGYIYAWDIKTGKMLKKIVFPGAAHPPDSTHVSRVGYAYYKIRYAPSGQWFLVAPGETLGKTLKQQGFYLIDSNTYKTAQEYEYDRYTLPIYEIYWSKDSTSFTLLELKDIRSYRCTR